MYVKAPVWKVPHPLLKSEAGRGSSQTLFRAGLDLLRLETDVLFTLHACQGVIFPRCPQLVDLSVSVRGPNAALLTGGLLPMTIRKLQVSR